MKTLVESLKASSKKNNIRESISEDAKEVKDVLKQVRDYKKLRGNCEAWVDEYARGEGAVKIIKFDAKTEEEALSTLLKQIDMYTNGEYVEVVDGNLVVDGEEVSLKELVSRLVDQNGDGCDYIHYFTFKNKAIIEDFDPYDIIDKIEVEDCVYIQA